MLAKHSCLTSNSSGSFVQFIAQNFVAKSFTYFFTQKVTHFIPEGKINKYMISSINLSQIEKKNIHLPEAIEAIFFSVPSEI